MVRQLTAGTGSSAKNLVAFQVGDIVYAVDIGRVREIIRPMPMMALPHMPETVVGVVDHRGDVVPIIDLRMRFGVPTERPGRSARWVIVTRADRLTGLVVDGVTEVFSGLPQELRGVPEIGSGEAARGIIAIYANRGRLVFVLDVDKLVMPGEHIDIASARAVMASWRPDA